MPSPYTVGMPTDALVLHWNSPAMKVTEKVHPERYRADVRFKSDQLLESGYVAGESHLLARLCMISVRYGDGEIILYGFRPQFRAQTDGTYKLIFNTLYKESN